MRGVSYGPPPCSKKQLAATALEHCPDVPYCPSSTHGGDFPFSAAAGVTSYYGVGAYLRPIDDARRSELRFASECLAFANVPEDERFRRPVGACISINPDGKSESHATWAQAGISTTCATTISSGCFVSTRQRLRYSEPDRYLRLSRSDQRRNDARGVRRMAPRAIDVQRRAGLVPSGPVAGRRMGGHRFHRAPRRRPTTTLKRAFRDTALFITDEGTNGLALHLVNDGPRPVAGQLWVELFKSSESVGRPVKRAITVDARSVLELNATELFEGFVDLSYAYRFGPPSHDVMRATLECEGIGESIEAFHFPLGLPGSQADAGLSVTARAADERVSVEITCRGFAQAVHVEAPGYVADAQYFHMAPRSHRTVTLSPRSDHGGRGAFEGAVHALNSTASQRIVLTR